MAAVDCNGYKCFTASPQKWRAMTSSAKLQKECYTETEAADAIGVSVSRLHRLLDEYVFNDGTPRPAALTFRASDLVLLGFWHLTSPNPKVVRMPHRN